VSVCQHGGCRHCGDGTPTEKYTPRGDAERASVNSGVLTPEQHGARLHVQAARRFHLSNGKCRGVLASTQCVCLRPLLHFRACGCSTLWCVCSLDGHEGKTEGLSDPSQRVATHKHAPCSYRSPWSDRQDRHRGHPCAAWAQGTSAAPRRSGAWGMLLSMKTESACATKASRRILLRHLRECADRGVAPERD